jgi:hypothetical protein
MNKCPYCAELIQDEAIICRFCDHVLDQKKFDEVSALPQKRKDESNSKVPQAQEQNKTHEGADKASRKTLCSINIDWDEFGNLSHTIHRHVPMDDYQAADGLALGVVLLTGSQLGILLPRFGLRVCDRILKFIEGEKLSPQPIQYPISSARIDLHMTPFPQKKTVTVVCTFHPKIKHGGTMDPEEAVCRLLGNLPPYATNHLIDELAGYLRLGLLSAVGYYLQTGLRSGISKGIFSKGKFEQHKVQFTMLAFNDLVYPHWRGGLSLKKTVFEEMLNSARSNYNSLVKMF